MINLATIKKYVNDLIIKLDEVITALGNIEIDTEGIDLNTDEIEGKLDILNATDFSTSEKQDDIIAKLAEVIDTPEFFEDTSFVTGDSPVTLDLNTALGRNATQGYIINDGAGNFTVSFSTDGIAFGDAITMKKNEILEFEKISVDSIKITWVSDSAYRVSVI